MGRCAWGWCSLCITRPPASVTDTPRARFIERPKNQHGATGDILQRILQHTLQHTLQLAATQCNILEHAGTCCNTPYRSRPHMLLASGTYCSTLQLTATHCNPLQPTAPQSDKTKTSALP